MTLREWCGRIIADTTVPGSMTPEELQTHLMLCQRGHDPPSLETLCRVLAKLGYDVVKPLPFRARRLDEYVEPLSGPALQHFLFLRSWHEVF